MFKMLNHETDKSSVFSVQTQTLNLLNSFDLQLISNSAEILGVGVSVAVTQAQQNKSSYSYCCTPLTPVCSCPWLWHARLHPLTTQQQMAAWL